MKLMMYPCSPEIEDWDFLSVGHLSRAGAWSRVIKKWAKAV